MDSINEVVIGGGRFDPQVEFRLRYGVDGKIRVVDQLPNVEVYCPYTFRSDMTN